MTWYFFLQIFGSNKFAIELKSSVPTDCGSFEELSILYSYDSLNASQVNHLNRVTYRTSAKNIPLSNDPLFFECTGIVENLVLVDREGIWGMYALDRDGVDILLTELDILIVQKSYGKGVSR
ncbi:MAG: hypothetical protein ABJG78_06015 [Cyclobacteriaceae bacterium]